MDNVAALGLVAWLLIGAGGLVGATAVTGGILYASDFAVEATIVDKECSLSNLASAQERFVAVKTKLFAIDHKLADVPLDQCNIIQVGNFVEYHIRSGHTRVYDSEGGKCLFDSETTICK